MALERLASMSDLKIRFGKRLRKLRRNMDLTQEQLAERCGVSADFISQVERGVNSPSFETIQKLAEILEVDASEFFFPPEKK
jgi:transcriptional regulator with XRE-family HTH domain